MAFASPNHNRQAEQHKRYRSQSSHSFPFQSATLYVLDQGDTLRRSAKLVRSRG